MRLATIYADGRIGYLKVNATKALRLLTRPYRRPERVRRMHANYRARHR